MSIVEVGFRVLFGLFTAATLVSSLWYLLASLPEPTQFDARQQAVGEEPASAQQLGVTVLICARNEAPNLRRYLPAVLGQISPVPFEVLIVDDASSDDTPHVLAFFQKQHPHLRVLRLSAKNFPGKKHALTQGVAAAKYDTLLLTDADCQPRSAHWLAAMSAPLRENLAIEIVLGYAPCGLSGSIVASAPWLDRWIRFETAHTASTYLAFARMGLPYMGVGRNLAWRRRAFERVGGFAAHQHVLSGDDDLLVQAISTRRNTAMCLDPQAFVFSEGKKTWRTWYAQKHRHMSAGALYQPIHRLLLGALALTHSGHYAALLVLTFSDWALWAWALWTLRIIVVRWGWLRASRRLQESGLMLYLPVLDAMMGVYFGVSGLMLLFAKKQTLKW